MASLDAFFNPASIVVIGASRDPVKLGYGVARNLIGSGYSGEIFLVNPKGGEVFGYPLHKSAKDLPRNIDLGLIVIPARYVLETLNAYSDKGVKNFIILTGGFSETGEKGMAIELEVKRLIQKEGLRVIGPNCIGIIDTHLPLDTTFIQPPMPETGSVAFISHSGALGAAIIDWSREEGFGFSRVISLGNQIDVTESDVLLPTAEADETKVLTMYLEGVGDGRKFIEQGTAASSCKPVIVYKVGQSKAGQQAAASHTGALAGTNIAYRAAFRRAGMIEARSTEEMFSWAKLFATVPTPKGNRVVILTNAGGPGVAAVDVVAESGLEIADYSEATSQKLATILPEAASIRNPVDMLASAPPRVYAECLKVLINDPGVDMALVIAPPPPMFEAREIAQALVPVILATGKPVAISFMGSQLVRDGIAVVRSEGIPEFSFPEDAISAFGALWRNTSLQKRNYSIVEPRLPSGCRETVEDFILRSNKESDFLDSGIAFRILAAYGLPMLELKYAKDEKQAVQIWKELGANVAMKLAVPDVSHKSDVGGVLLDVSSEEELVEGLKKLLDRYLSLGGREQDFGVHLQPMAISGQEVILGGVRDPIFGPLVMFGSGGTEVEGMGDVSFSIAPLTATDLDHIIDSTWAGRRLKGFRQLQPADIDAVRLAIARLGRLLVDHPEIEEVEINPLIVGEVGAGCKGVDARMMLGKGS
jgi:acetyltransferase